jgi:hypothetical protein
MEKRGSVIVWLPERQQIGVAYNGALANDLKQFSMNELTATVESINNTKSRDVIGVKRAQRLSSCIRIDVQWNNQHYPQSLYHLLPASSIFSETRNIHYSRPLETIGYTRMHEIGDVVGKKGIVDIMNMDACFPGKRPHLLYEGYFVGVEGDGCKALLKADSGALEFELDDSSLVDRLIGRHGDPEKASVFRIEQESEGEWVIKGVHPMVVSNFPTPRSFSRKHDEIEKGREPSDETKIEAWSTIPDSLEMLRKASQSSSTWTSPSKKAAMGSSSLKQSFRRVKNSPLHDSIADEMMKNGVVMDELRYLLQSSILFTQVLSRMCIVLSKAPASNLIIKSKFKRDSCLEVCKLFFNLPL